MERKVSLETESEEVSHAEITNWKTPTVKTSIWVTNNGKWVVHRTTVTEIKPLAYYEKVFA